MRAHLFNGLATVILPILLSVAAAGCSRTGKSDSRLENSRTSTAESELKELEADIARVPDMILSLKESDCESLESIWKRIKKLPNVDMRRQLFWKYQDGLLSARLEKVGNVHARDWKEQQEVFRRLGWHYTWIEHFTYLVSFGLEGCKSSVKEIFEPFFRYYEAMRLESQRIGHNARGYPSELNHIEYTYWCFSSMKEYKPDDFVWLKEEFKRVAGRPLRTFEEYVEETRAAAKKRDKTSRPPSATKAAPPASPSR